MPPLEPTIQDVLLAIDQLANTVDQIKRSTNKIKGQVEIWDICTTCKGLGYLVGYIDTGPGQKMEQQLGCPTCLGNTKLRKGQLEGGTEE